MFSRPSPSGCSICGAPGDLSFRFAATDRRFSLFACSSCSAGRTWPPVARDEIGEFYPAEYYGTNNVRFNPLLEYLTRVFRRRRARVIRKRTSPDGGTVLDVGCGRGMILDSLRRGGYATLGLEISDDAAKHARSTLGLEVATEPFLDLDRPRASFGAIIFWHSLEHLDDPVAAIRHASALLRPGGLLVVAVPNCDAWQAKLFGRHWFHLDIPRHYHHFGRRSLASLLEKSGFSIVQTDHFSFEQNPYGWIQSFLNALGFETNLLYSVLKHESARTARLHRFPIQVALNLLLLPLLLPASVALTVFDAAVRSGGTIEIYAVRKPEGA